MQDIEIEIQVRIEKSDTLKQFLQEKAGFVSERQQIDEYYVPAHRNFLDANPIQEWFRLRSESDATSMNYKKWHYDSNGIGQYADEYETIIDDIACARKILLALDCKPIVTVDKTRKKWSYQDYEIALDSVKGLGDFVEIEYKGAGTVDPDYMKREMTEFLKGQNCGTIEINNGGYPQLLLFPEKAQFIKV